jgi:hypothetical protein
MPSKGSPFISLRLPGGMLEELDSLIAAKNQRRRESPWTRSSFVISAIQEKIAHYARSARKPRHKAMQIPPAEAAAELGATRYGSVNHHGNTEAAIDNASN